ncbi:MAG: copper chaperone PCu(A)C [Hyphomonadaceae bacterium]
MHKIVFAAALFLAACGAPAHNEAAHEDGALRIEDARAAPSPEGVDVAAGYLTIVNGTSEDDRLLGATSPRAARVELHEMTMDGAVMQMRAIEAIPAPAGQEVSLAPGGAHLMFFGVSTPFAEGEEIPVQLQFENAGEINLSLPVRRVAPQNRDTH